MPLFDDINLSTIKTDNDIYISSKELAWHIVDSMQLLHQEALDDARAKPFSSEEYYYFTGVMQGMNSIVMLLSQGGMEEEIHSNINNVEDLLKYMKDDNND